MIKNIGFDIDGTLIDELSYCVNNFLEDYYLEKHEKYTGRMDIHKYDIVDRFPDCERDFIDAWIPKYWAKYLREAPFRPYVRELFVKLKQMGVTIHIVTARTPHNGQTIEDVENITKQRFEEAEIPVDVYHVGIEEKDSILAGNGIELLVEDDVNQVLKVAEKFPVFIFHTPYNTYVRGRNIWRIDSFEPNAFIDNIKYAFEHVDNWDIEYDYNEAAEESGLDIVISKNKTIVFNGKNLKTKNICFVIPFGNDKDISFAKKLALELKASIIRLDLLEVDPETINPVENELLLRMIQQCNRKKINLLDPNSTKAYNMKCEIIEKLLKDASSRKNKNFIFFGIQSMMLSRDITEKYKENTIYITSANAKDCTTCMNNKYRKDYTPWILMEDLTEVGTQNRKWKIIAGTAPAQIATYINRQTTSSDGIDMVHLLPDESPYEEQRLLSAINMDTWLLADCHISTKDHAKTDRIIHAINRNVSPSDTLLFLGDFDGKKGTSDKGIIHNFLKQLKCKNIYLILGNNDQYAISDYIKMGFLGITDKAEFQESPSRKVILTHCPCPVSQNEVNIHGHIHGSRCYWNMDWRQHYDIWDEDFIPIKIRTCLEILDNDGYKAHSENHPIR